MLGPCLFIRPVCKPAKSLNFKILTDVLSLGGGKVITHTHLVESETLAGKPGEARLPFATVMLPPQAENQSLSFTGSLSLQII